VCELVACAGSASSYRVHYIAGDIPVSWSMYRLVKDVVTAMSRCTFRNGRLLYGCCRLQVVSACSAAAVDTEAGGGACEAEAAQVKPSQ